MKLKHYVVATSYKTSGYEDEAFEIEDRDIDSLRKVIKPDVVKFHFHDILVDEVDYDGEKVELKSAPINVTEKYYIGEVMSLDEVAETDSQNAWLHEDVEAGHTFAVMTRAGVRLALFGEDMERLIDPSEFEKDSEDY